MAGCIDTIREGSSKAAKGHGAFSKGGREVRELGRGVHGGRAGACMEGGQGRAWRQGRGVHGGRAWACCSKGAKACMEGG